MDTVALISPTLDYRFALSNMLKIKNPFDFSLSLSLPIKLGLEIDLHTKAKFNLS